MSPKTFWMHDAVPISSSVWTSWSMKSNNFEIWCCAFVNHQGQMLARNTSWIYFLIQSNIKQESRQILGWSLNPCLDRWLFHVQKISYNKRYRISIYNNLKHLYVLLVCLLELLKGHLIKRCYFDESLFQLPRKNLSKHLVSIKKFAYSVSQWPRLWWIDL